MSLVCIHFCLLPFLSSQPDLRYLTIPISPGPPWCGKGPLSSLFFCNLPLHGKGISDAVHNNQRPLKFADFSACLFYFLPSPCMGKPPLSPRRLHISSIFPGTVVPVSGWVSPQSAACPPAENRNQPAYKVAGEYKRNPGFEFIVKLTRTKKQNHLDSPLPPAVRYTSGYEAGSSARKTKPGCRPASGRPGHTPPHPGPVCLYPPPSDHPTPPFQNFNLPLEYPHNVICHVCPWRLPHCNCA